LKLPPGVTKLPKGVEIHGNRLRISFMYGKKRCREPLPGVAKITKSAIAYAERKRQSILTEIREDRFNYALHFPDSKNAKLFSGWGGPDIQKTVEEALEEWLAFQERVRAPSTFRNYRSKSRKLTRKWPRNRLCDIKKSEIEMFQSELLEEGLSPKTVTNPK